MRQVVDPQAEILLAKSYSPYGEVTSSVGDYKTDYSYTGEMTDGTGLVNLRARYYDPGTGRFISKDMWGGDYNNPITLMKWVYANANPVIYVDRSGSIAESEEQDAANIISYLKTVNVNIVVDWGRDWTQQSVQKNISKLTCSWETGIWTLNELYIVEGAVQNLNRAMNQKMKYYIGSVQISKVPPSSFPARCNGATGCTTGSNIQLVDNNTPPKNAPVPTNLIDYYITGSGTTTNFSQWAVVHELAHAWENHNKDLVGGSTSLSDQLVAYTKTNTSPTTVQQHVSCGKGDEWRAGCNTSGYFYYGTPAKGSDKKFNAREDFAESVAAFVFPKYAQKAVNVYKGDPEKENFLYYSDYTQTDRWKFINSLIIQEP